MKALQRVSIDLNGGLGNQLFQWAAGLEIAFQKNAKLVLDTTMLTDRNFELPLDLINNIWNNTEIRNSRIINRFEIHQRHRLRELQKKFKAGIEENIKEKSYSFQGVKFESNRINLEGYFQSWKYFPESLPEIKSGLRKFDSKNPIFEEYLKVFSLEEWVTVHIRRGDYLKYPKTYEILGEEYYERALSLVKSELQDIKIAVFTDSPEFVRSLVKQSDLIIDNKILMTPFENLFLMSKGSALIGANSTFSWWAGLLADESSKIIFPEKWFLNGNSTADLLIPNWMILT